MRLDTDETPDGSGLINLTPVIDVVFLLLIFFMVTSTFQEDERDLTVTVPEAENGNPVEDLPRTIVVAVRADGSYAIGGKVVDREELRRVLIRAKRKNRKQRVIVRGDREVPFAHPIEVLDLCTGLGIATSVMTVEKAGG